MHITCVYKHSPEVRRGDRLLNTEPVPGNITLLWHKYQLYRIFLREDSQGTPF